MSEPSPWYAAKGVIASGVFLALLALAGVALALTGGDDATVAPAPAKQSGKVDDGGSVCGMPVGNTDPVVGPPAARWRLVGSVAVPTAKDVGPGLLEGKDRRCYAHSPLGATFAAANLLGLSSLPSGALSAEAQLRHFVPNRTRDVHARQPAAPVDPTGRVQLAGFKTTATGRDNVTVTLAVRVSTGSFAGALVGWEMPMRWIGGDWRLELLSVEEPFSGGPLASLDGFIPWGGA